MQRNEGMGLLPERVVVAAILSSISMAHPNPTHPETIRSLRAAHDAAFDLNPQSPFWRDASPIFFEGDNYGRPVKPLRTEVRSRWTDSNLYLLFVCPYLDLNLKPVAANESRHKSSLELGRRRGLHWIRLPADSPLQRIRVVAAERMARSRYRPGSTSSRRLEVEFWL